MERNKKITNLLNELKPIIKSYSEMSDIGFNAKARIYEEFSKKLNNYCSDNNINALIDYAEGIYTSIDWKNDEGVSGFINEGYLLVIVDILNLFIVENRKANYADFSDKKKDFERVMNIIKSFKRETDKEDITM